jgi:hypothetical protein
MILPNMIAVYKSSDLWIPMMESIYARTCPHVSWYNNDEDNDEKPEALSSSSLDESYKEESGYADEISPELS